MKSLSIRQPWAWLITEGWKPIENRTWSTDFRGRFLIHAGKGCTKAEYDACVTLSKQIDPCIHIPPLDSLRRGGIVGEAELIGCVTASASPWFFGKYGFVLRKPYPLPFREYPGQLGFFDVT